VIANLRGIFLVFCRKNMVKLGSGGILLVPDKSLHPE
jgi:hypothetical protein